MAKNIHTRTDAFLNDSRLLIEGARGEGDVAAQLVPYGYDRQALEAGKTLYDAAQALVALQRKEYGDQFQATEALDAAWTQADVEYGKALKLARVAFRDDTQAQAALRLGGIRPQSLGAWLDQVGTFYRNLLADPRLLAALAKLGVTKDKALADQALVQAVADRQVAQRKETSEAQEATERRDTALAALDRWAQDFRAVAKVALSERPQLLEQLGIRA